MTRNRSKAIVAAARGVALAALAFACAAQAQNTGSVNDYQLPPAPSAPPPSAQGPVDPENPVSTPRAPAPRPTAAPPTETPAPQRIVLPTSAAPTERQQPRAERPTQPAPTQAAAPSPEPPAPAEAPFLPPPAEPAPVASPTPAQTPAASQPEQEANWWPFLLGGAAALLALGAFLWLRRKPAEAEEPQFELAPAPLAKSPPTKLTPIAPKPIAATPRAPVSRPALAGSSIDFRLEPQSLRLSLVYATLSYRLDLANNESTALEALRISGGMISGHASLSVGEQLSPEGEGLEARHELASLAPGETVSLKGELRLPLNQIVPIRAGSAVLFAPLVRFLIEGTPGEREALADNHAFTIGLPGARPGGAMQPFRLDLGPQLFREVDQREIDLARWLPLDVARRAS